MLDRGGDDMTGSTVGEQAQSLLRVAGLRMTIAGKTLLDIPDLSIRDGGPTVISGPNGAGKSLLLRLLHGLTMPTEGAVMMHGQPLTPALCRRQAMVFQSPVILRRSVRANVEFALSARNVPRAERQDRAEAALQSAGLAAKARQPARSLSGGEQQKLALARALATEPEILFLDEPTSNLDPGAVQAIEMLVMEAAESGAKIILVTHDQAQARRLGHEVVFLHHGSVTEPTRAGLFFVAPRSPEGRAYLSGELLI